MRNTISGELLRYTAQVLCEKKGSRLRLSISHALYFSLTGERVRETRRVLRRGVESRQKKGGSGISSRVCASISLRFSVSFQPFFAERFSAFFFNLLCFRGSESIRFILWETARARCNLCWFMRHTQGFASRKLAQRVQVAACDYFWVFRPQTRYWTL